LNLSFPSIVEGFLSHLFLPHNEYLGSKRTYMIRVLRTTKYIFNFTKSMKAKTNGKKKSG